MGSERRPTPDRLQAAPGGHRGTDRPAGTSPGDGRRSPADGRRSPAAAELLELQRLAGNQATLARIEATRATGPTWATGPALATGPAWAMGRAAGLRVSGAPPRAGAPAHPRVQRLDIYGRAATRATALPEATAADFARQVEAGNRAMALSVVVAAMTARGELDTRLLRTSGEGALWQIREIGELAAEASFRSSFPDPDDSSRRLPNPRFSISPGMLSPGRADALERLHAGILHEYRHVQQAAERVNRPAAAGGPRAPGYANDPDEFDAYLSEVESSYSRMHMYQVALQAGVHWEFLAEADRGPFRDRWTAAQARIRRVLGYGVDALLATPAADRYREQMREAERRAREAWERHAR